MENTEEQRYKKARRKVKKLKSFYSHLLTYLLIASFLTFINWYSNYGNWWVIWVWIGWGIGLAFHAIGLFKSNILFGDDWEERKIKEEMEKMK